VGLRRRRLTEPAPTPEAASLAALHQARDRTRAVWRLLTGVLPISIAGWWLLPHGFPLTHPRFWTNQVLPWAIALAALLGLALARRRPAVGLGVGVILGGLGLGASVGAVAWFPLGGQVMAPPLVVPGIYFAVVAAKRLERRRWAPLLVAGLCVGALLPGSQLAPPSTTHPVSAQAPATPTSAPAAAAPLNLGDHVTASRTEGWLQVTAPDRPLLRLNPMLRFRDRSPERGWTNLTERRGRPPAWEQIGERASPKQISLAWTGETGQRWLELALEPAGVSLTAWGELPEPLYSHLNAFSELSLQGPGPFALSFSPCPQAEVEVRPADYPTGRPTRLACLTPEGTFRILEASSGEKGPFRELASGPLARGAPLSLTVSHQGQPMWRVTWEDWSAQCSTDLSPTAGWGLPQNALEFRLTEGGMVLWCTLAGTSIGRGWDSVGHDAGVYRNRVRVEPAGP